MLYQRTNGIWYDVTRDEKGKRKFRSLKTRDRAEAERRIKASEADRYDLLDGIARRFLAHSRQEHRPKTHKMYRDTILGSIDRGETWEERMDSISRDPGLRQATKDSYLRVLRSMLNWAAGKQRRRRQKAIDRIRDPLSADELPSLLSHLEDSRARLATKLAFYAGLRRDEVAGLEWRDIGKEEITIRVAKGQQGAVAERVPITDPVAEVLAEARDGLLIGSGPIFGMTGRQLSDRFREAKKAAGYGREIDFHSLRHGFGTWLGQNGVDAFTIQTLMRHKSLEQTRQYVRTGQRYAASVVNGLAKK